MQLADTCCYQDNCKISLISLMWKDCKWTKEEEEEDHQCDWAWLSLCWIQYPEEQPEYPVIERNYYVQFMFPADTSAHSSHLHNITQDDFEELGTIPDAEHHDLASDVVNCWDIGSLPQMWWVVGASWPCLRCGELSDHHEYWPHLRCVELFEHCELTIQMWWVARAS